MLRALLRCQLLFRQFDVVPAEKAMTEEKKGDVECFVGSGSEATAPKVCRISSPQT